MATGNYIANPGYEVDDYGIPPPLAPVVEVMCERSGIFINNITEIIFVQEISPYQINEMSM